MASKNLKKIQSTNRAGSASNKEAGSLAPPIIGQDARKLQRFVIWPEWSDTDINAEKWDVTHKGKEKEKGKSPVVQHYFEDPDGKVELPLSLRVDHWKRPQEFIVDKTPVIVDPDHMNKFELPLTNEEVYQSELMRWIASQFTALWRLCAVKIPPEGVEPGVPTDKEFMYTWRPWELIYSMNKVGKGPNQPMYNPSGKYVIKLYWMGCWRKLVVDDMIPFDDDGHMLLPATTVEHELWPMLLTKALVKIASLDYNGGNSACEFGDFSVIQCLTGWLPETIPLQYGHLNEVWNLLKTSLPEWKLPDMDADKTDNAKDAQDVKDDKDKDNKDRASDKAETKNKGKESKEDKKDKKDKDKDKDKGKDKPAQEDASLPMNPEILVFASYCGSPKYPVRVSLLGEMADASERLRQAGISHMYPHPVHIKMTRSCPLEPPPPPQIVPAWKLIRPKKKKVPTATLR